MDAESDHTKEELEDILTEKQQRFSKFYVVHWNGSKAARDAGYGESGAAAESSRQLRNVHVKAYIELIRSNFEELSGVSKVRNLQELAKIAYSSIADMHDTWITRKDFEGLTDDQKAAIESIETDTSVLSEKVKIKLHSKQAAILEINKMMGYNQAEKVDITSKGKQINPADLSTDELIVRAKALKGFGKT